MSTSADRVAELGNTGPDRRRRRVTVAVGLALLVVVSTGLALAIIETAVRIWVVTVTPNILVLDDEIGWTHRMNLRREVETDGLHAVIETNELGARGPAYRGPSSRTRLLLLGDSLAAGAQVSNDQLFSILWERQRPDLEIVNTGVSGYGTVQEILMARRVAPAVQPSLSVLMVYAGNDLTDNVMPFDEVIGPRPYVDAQGHFHPLEWQPFRPLLLPIPGATWLHRHSLASYVVHKRVLSSMPDRYEYVEHWKTALPDETKWRVLDHLVEMLHVERPIAIVAVPTREAVSTGDTAFVERLRKTADRLGVRFVSLQEALRPEHFFTSDFHWNPAGHHAVAAYLGSVW